MQQSLTKAVGNAGDACDAVDALKADHDSNSDTVHHCFKAGTRLIMEDGSTKLVQYIAEDDRLIGPDSTVYRVRRGTRATYKEPVHKIAIYNKGTNINIASLLNYSSQVYIIGIKPLYITASQPLFVRYFKRPGEVFKDTMASGELGCSFRPGIVRDPETGIISQPRPTLRPIKEISAVEAERAQAYQDYVSVECIQTVPQVEACGVKSYKSITQSDKPIHFIKTKKTFFRHVRKAYSKTLTKEKVALLLNRFAWLVGTWLGDGDKRLPIIYQIRECINNSNHGHAEVGSLITSSSRKSFN